MKKVLFIFFILSAFVCGESSAQLNPGIRTVVIDPGHGGADPGAVSTKHNIREKDVVLDVAKRLGKSINELYPDVDVKYTRTTDVLIDLNQRADIANKAGADLFISIHINAAKSNSSASGTETLVMGVDDLNRNMELVKQENDVIKFEEDYESKYEPFVPGSPESLIMFSTMQYASQEQSLVMAGIMQKHFVKNTRMPNRGVKQLPIRVLWRTTMPAILTEFGFMSTSEDAKYIGSDAGKAMYAKCIFDAFSEYKTRVEGGGNPVLYASVISETANVSGADAGGLDAAPATSGEKAVYRIQVLSSAKKVPRNSQQFGPYRGEVKEIIIDGRYKYFTKEAKTYKEALFLQKDVRKYIKDAFIAAFIAGKQITVEEAKRNNNEL